METQGPQRAKTILRKKNKAGGIELPISKYSRKQQLSEQYSSGTETVTQINETDKRAQKLIATYMTINP